MAAYEAVVSLQQTLDTILDPGGPRISHNKTQLRSFREKVSLLLDFLENYSFYGISEESALKSWERDIIDVAYWAEDVIESRLSKQLRAKPKTKSSGVRIRIFGRFFTVNGYHVGILLILAWLLIFMAIILVKPISIHTFTYANYQNATVVVAQILVAFVVLIVVPCYILSVSPDKVRCLVHEAVLKWISSAAHYRRCISQVFDRVGTSSAAACRKYDSHWDDQEFNEIVDDISYILKEVIKIEDSCSSSTGQETQCENVLSMASSFRHDSGGSGKNVIVGFENDLAEIKTRLISDSPKVEIVSIVGMGGIGKTTLAREVYDDRYIVSHFDTRAWMTISQEYSLRRVLLSLLDSAKMLKEEMLGYSEALLTDCLYKNLKRRRYLIVMDDIWDTEIWDAVNISFPDDNNGSRVLLTSRLTQVALYANSFIHRMHFLNQEDSWKLLCNKVFGEKDSCKNELEGIGKEIAQNCKGLPLAIAVIGGLLSKVGRTTESWKILANNLSSVVTKDDKQCTGILSLSYNHLPHRLRPCFLYMGMFPEDYEIPVAKLVRLWAAEGFLKPSKSKSLEELAEEYLEDLIDRNLIFVCKRSPCGKIKTCNIHDLLWKLCICKSEKENFFHRGCDEKTTSEITRRFHIYITLGDYDSTFEKLDRYFPSSRSILFMGEYPFYCSSTTFLLSELLRVLDFRKVVFPYFPDEITDLLQLRYLALMCTGALPPSISKLWNLQTLVLRNWTYRQCANLPMEIWLMPKLRHLCVTPSYLPGPHVGILVKNSSLLENLQTLSEIRNFKCRKYILERLPNLKQLKISYIVFPSVKWSEYQLEALVHLHKLETLKILIRSHYKDSNIVYPPKLAFPQKLKRLTLSGCGIPWESMRLVGALKNLEVLKLKRNACRGTRWKPADGQFCKLKYLLLEGIDLLKWEANETHFPLLEYLVIRSCYMLKEIPSAIGEIPTLEKIELVDCHPSAVMSAKQLQEEQESMGNEDLKVHVDSRHQFEE